MTGFVDLIGGLFGASKPAPVVVNTPQFPTIKPTAVAPPPDRSSAEVAEAAAEQRRKYGVAGGRTPTNLTGGLGVPQGAVNYAASNLLGA